MKIISYNLNGLRAATKLNVLNWIKQEDADIICLQEVREEQNVCEEIFKKMLFTWYRRIRNDLRVLLLK